jgi:hypothetical protein
VSVPRYGVRTNSHGSFWDYRAFDDADSEDAVDRAFEYAAGCVRELRGDSEEVLDEGSGRKVSFKVVDDGWEWRHLGDDFDVVIARLS